MKTLNTFTPTKITWIQNVRLFFKPLYITIDEPGTVMKFKMMDGVMYVYDIKLKNKKGESK